MIENVFTIGNSKEDLAESPEFWQNAGYDEKLLEATSFVTEKNGFAPRANTKIIREISFPIKASTTISQLRYLAGLLKEKFKINCFQISIDRHNGMAHLLFTWIDNEGKCVVLNWLDQTKLSVMVLRVLNLPRPHSVNMWMRYFLLDAFEDDPLIFKRQLDALYHGEIEKFNLPFLRDVMLYAEAMCKGQLK